MTVDGARLLERLQLLRAVGSDGGGVTRLAWTAADRRAVEIVGGWAADAGATVHVDAAGTLVADLAGTEPGLAPLAMGSHLDTVVRAGHLDGAYGVVAAVEIIAALARHPLRHPVRVAAFANEEGVVAPPFTGSRAAAGNDLSGELDRTGPDGTTLRDRLLAAGCQPDGLAGAAWPALAGYLELHIEQGPVLDTGGWRAGVVTGIAGQRRATVQWSGAANHAGTTPMALRRDALVAAAAGILAVQRLATTGPVDVATVGAITAAPGVANVVPGSAAFTLDVRSGDDAALDAALDRLTGELHAIAGDTRTTVEVALSSASGAVPTHPVWCRLLASACSAWGIDALLLSSGAGHDAQHLASLAPVGMLFVPSTDGVSHSPAEHTGDDDLVLGAQVALDALVKADSELHVAAA